MIDRQLYFTLGALLLPVLERILLGCCLAVLIKPFMEKKEKVWRIWAAYSLTILTFYAMGRHPDSSTAVSISLFAALIVLCRTDRRNYEQKIFLMAAFSSLCWLSCAITEILYDNLYYYATHTDYMMSHPDLWGILYLGMCVVYLISEVSITFAGIRLVQKAYSYKSANMMKKELCMLLAPLFTGTAGFIIIHHYRGFYIIETGKSTKEYDLWAMIYYTVSIAVVIVMIGLYQSIKARQEEKLHNELLASQLDSIRYHIEQVEGLYQNIRSIRHDMTNHILTLEGLYAGNKLEEAKEYSARLKAAFTETAGGIRSGNPVTDVILQEWSGRAAKKGIRFQSDFCFPTGSGINAFDISVILNNALQNAVENTPENASVSIRSYRRSNAYMIEVINSFPGKLLRNTEIGLPLTSKMQSEGHGYGLPSIRKVAAKYAGDLAVDLKEKEFHLNVMLMLETVPAEPSATEKDASTT